MTPKLVLRFNCSKHQRSTKFGKNLNKNFTNVEQNKLLNLDNSSKERNSKKLIGMIYFLVIPLTNLIDD